MKCYSDCPWAFWTRTYFCKRWVKRPHGIVQLVFVEHWACKSCSALHQSEWVLDTIHIYFRRENSGLAAS